MSFQWWHKAVVYQIYPRSFYDSNGDGVGDLPGITSKLDYLRDLGVGAIWLSPIFVSPMADFGYDISDYTAIDPIFGSLDEFDELVHAAHNRGMKVLMDFVPNHTSNRHPWFLESQKSKNNPKSGWYIWADGRQDGSRLGEPNNWLSVFGGSGWEWCEERHQYYFHSFLKEQPDLNWRNPEVVEAMKGAITFWLDRGVDGFRVDAVYHLFKDAHLRDEPKNPNYTPGKDDPYAQLLHLYSQGQPETLKTINELCGMFEKYGGRFLLTELYQDVAGMGIYFRACENGHHSPFNLNLIGMPWSAEAYRKFVDEFEESLEQNDWPNYILGNHDKPRVASRVGERRAKLLALMIFTLRGLPIVYYGEEIGMKDAIIPPELVQDPFEKRVPGMGLGRDPQRTPMLWSGDVNAGFTTGKPWLPVSPDYKTINVEVEQAGASSMLNLYKRLIQLRASSAALLEGKYESIDIKNNDVFTYSRTYKEKKYVILLNFSEQDQSVEFQYPFNAAISSYADFPHKEGTHFTLRPYEGLVLKAVIDV